MSRFWVVMSLVFAFVSTGCVGSRIDYSKADADKPGSTFLVLGLFSVFSLGLEQVADDLEDEGFHARTLSGPRWGDIGDRIIELERDGKLRRPLVLGGHSLGADKALYLANKLNKAGITVDYICLLDATNPPSVPSNVKRCHNIFLSHPYTDWIPVFRGIKVDADSPDTELVNFDVRYAATGPLSEIDFNHFDIESDDDIQALMTDLIRAQLIGDPNYASIIPPDSRIRTE